MTVTLCRCPLVGGGGTSFWRLHRVEAMTRKLLRGIVSDRRPHVIHVVRVLDDILDLPEIDEITARMSARILARHGDQTPNVVLIQGDTKETLRLFGESHAITVVRAALFNAAIAWSPLEIDELG
jgi:hypothetical protein